MGAYIVQQEIFDWLIKLSILALLSAGLMRGQS